MTARAAGQHCAVLATGDPLCHGIATYLLARLPDPDDPEVRILPAPSTLQIACARWRTAWQDISIASCHTRDAGEWLPGATPAHGLYPLMRCIARKPRVFAFLGPENDAARLGRALLTAGYPEARLSLASRLLGPDETIARRLSPAEVAERNFPHPCVALIERDTPIAAAGLGRADADYLQRAPEKGLITKQEVRLLSLAKLALRADAVLWDIGAGSGALGLEAAELAPLGHVWAIEKNPADAAIARANAARFRVSNYTLVEGRAPADLTDWPDPDAVFIGGSGGELAELIDLALDRLKAPGRLVMNFVTLENLATATTVLRQRGAVWDVVQLQANRSQPILALHRLSAQNPVWIVTAGQPGQTARKNPCTSTS
jgi:precorrin-6Y C5,15-methyltransferase (decarboxylating)